MNYPMIVSSKNKPNLNTIGGRGINTMKFIKSAKNNNSKISGPITCNLEKGSF
jgi:hypothetical protein